MASLLSTWISRFVDLGLMGSRAQKEEPLCQVRQWADTTIRRVSREWKVRGGVMEKVTQLLVTPRVVREVRSHFGCPTLEGAELEDQGGDGTALTHWEKRIFQVCECEYLKF